MAKKELVHKLITQVFSSNDGVDMLFGEGVVVCYVKKEIRLFPREDLKNWTPRWERNALHVLGDYCYDVKMYCFRSAKYSRFYDAMYILYLHVGVL